MNLPLIRGFFFQEKSGRGQPVFGCHALLEQGRAATNYDAPREIFSF